MMMTYLETYLQHICDEGSFQLSEAIQKTVSDIVPEYISNFSFRDHVTGLLVGEIQSGKTSHVLGLICATADEGFGIFLLLTTDTIVLQQQTYARAKKSLEGFCVCDESDYLLFEKNQLKKPVVIVLKKNSHILRQWKNNLSSTNFCVGNPLYIVDDEADAASLNTQVNKKKQSTINSLLESIKQTASSSIYLQVTATPQAILLQSIQSGWRPYFLYYFKPGNGYLGGSFFFPQSPPPSIVLTDNEEFDDLLVDDEFPENGLKKALLTHLITSGQVFLSGGSVSNFLIHPSFRTSLHEKFATIVGDYLNEINLTVEEPDTIMGLRQVYEELLVTKNSLLPFDRIYQWIRNLLNDGLVNILVINSITTYDDNVQYDRGVNVIIGGNSLSRGVTFPQLQTIYYCRVSKNPQADTMWQHARIFGYDRDPELVRVFMPPILYKLFSDINSTNNTIISQIKTRKTSDIKIICPPELRPTRKNVIDKEATTVFAGNVNYFPFYPTNKDIGILDQMLAPFGDDIYSVSLKLILQILDEVDSASDDWNSRLFAGFVNVYISEKPIAQGKLIVRRERDIGKGTGTLLSPKDRELGNQFSDDIVLTMYKITGTKGWEGLKLWIPNIKLPGGVLYYSA